MKDKLPQLHKYLILQDSDSKLWFCPMCDFCSKGKAVVVRHYQREHQRISGKGVIL